MMRNWVLAKVSRNLGYYPSGHNELLEEPRVLIIADRIFISTGGVFQRAVQIGFASTSRAADDHIEFLSNPFRLN